MTDGKETLDSKVDQDTIDELWESWEGFSLPASAHMKLDLAKREVELGDLFPPLPGSDRAARLAQAKLDVISYQAMIDEDKKLRERLEQRKLAREQRRANAVTQTKA